jgi:CHASE3 domain sensor protein
MTMFQKDFDEALQDWIIERKVRRIQAKIWDDTMEAATVPIIVVCVVGLIVLVAVVAAILVPLYF